MHLPDEILDAIDFAARRCAADPQEFVFLFNTAVEEEESLVPDGIRELIAAIDEAGEDGAVHHRGDIAPICTHCAVFGVHNDPVKVFTDAACSSQRPPRALSAAELHQLCVEILRDDVAARNGDRWHLIQPTQFSCAICPRVLATVDPPGDGESTCPACGAELDAVRDFHADADGCRICGSCATRLELCGADVPRCTACADHVLAERPWVGDCVPFVPANDQTHRIEFLARLIRSETLDRFETTSWWPHYVTFVQRWAPGTGPNVDASLDAVPGTLASLADHMSEERMFQVLDCAAALAADGLGYTEALNTAAAIAA